MEGCCTIADSIGVRKYKWKIEEPINCMIIRTMFPDIHEDNSRLLVCDNVKITLTPEWKRLEPGKLYIVNVPVSKENAAID
jgi:hypothetical protein